MKDNNKYVMTLCSWSIDMVDMVSGPGQRLRVEGELKPRWGDNGVRETQWVWVMKSAGKTVGMKRLRATPQRQRL